MRGTPEPADEASRTRQTIESVLGALPFAMWTVRPSLRIDFANAAAADLTQSSNVVKVIKGRMVQLGKLDMGSLRQAIIRPVAPGQTELTVVLKHDGQYTHTILHVIPVRRLPAVANAWPQAQALLVLELGPLRASSAWLAYVVQHWGLTEAHGHVLEDLSRGYTVDAIAARRAVKAGTIRTHLHEVFKRTGLERQVNLVRLALGKWHDDFEGQATTAYPVYDPDDVLGHVAPTERPVGEPPQPKS